MFFMKNVYKIFIILLFLSFFAMPAQANPGINVYFFYGDGCPHCGKEEEFLDKLEIENKNIKIYRYEVWRNKENSELLQNLAKNMKLHVQGVPLTIIGDRTVSGYYNEDTTGAKILSIIKDFEDKGCVDLEDSLFKENRSAEQCMHVLEGCEEECDENCDCEDDCGCVFENLPSDTEILDSVHIPFLGEVNAKTVSLPILTLLIAATDGFNPCAMWVLLFLISLLLGMENKKRMWILGLAFIVSSGAVYFLFLSAWLNLFLFLGFIFWIRFLIGFVALGSGSYHLYDAYKNRGGGCHVTKSEKRQAIFKRLRALVAEKKFYLAVLGIVLLAAAVNLVELVCSAGLPAVYTQVLASAGLAKWQYYAYLIFYIFIFMLDDMLIFFIAMRTLEIKAISSKYTVWAQWVGGIVIFIIGLLLIFKPGWIMFG
jgi:glutaredoxin